MLSGLRRGWRAGVSHVPLTRRYRTDVEFALLLDVDGVLMGGQTCLSSVRQLFSRMLDTQGGFTVPVVFVTNAGNTDEKSKAQQLSHLLQAPVSVDQLVLSHSPLRLFSHLHQRHVLLSGQGELEETAQHLGFRNTLTIEKLRETFPLLDVVDHHRRPKNTTSPQIPASDHLPQIEAVVLLGEPIRWETNLQLIMDVLLTNGRPGEAVTSLLYPHMPVLACNMDLMWTADAKNPRFGHGSFLVCLESVYQKVTGRPLQYQALLGKPSVITYNYSVRLIQEQLRSHRSTRRLRRLYAIGDNLMSDVYGANHYDCYLKSATSDLLLPESCSSILVCTGVYKPHVTSDLQQINHGHRDFSPEPDLTRPTHTVQDVTEAVELVFQLEGRSLP